MPKLSLAWRHCSGVALALLAAYLALPMAWAQSPVPTTSTVANRPSTYRVGGLWTVTDADQSNCASPCAAFPTCPGSLQLMCQYTASGWASTSTGTGAAAQWGLQNTTDLHPVTAAVRCIMPWGATGTAVGPRICAVDAGTDYLELDTDGDLTADIAIKQEADKTVFEMVGAGTDKTIEFRNSGGAGSMFLLADGYDTPQGATGGCVGLWEGSGATPTHDDQASWCAPDSVPAGGIVMKIPSGLATGTYNAAVGDTSGVATSAATAATATNLAGTGDYAIPYQSATNDTTLMLANGTTGQWLKATTSGAPSWADQSAFTAGNATNATNATTSTLAAADTNTTAIATTSFVQQEINGAGGAGLACSSGSCATASQEAGFVADGGTTGLTCSTSNQGKVQVMDVGTLQYCDGATTSVKRQVDTTRMACASYETPVAGTDNITIIPLPAIASIQSVGCYSRDAASNTVTVETNAPATIKSTFTCETGTAVMTWQTSLSNNTAIASGTVIRFDSETMTGAGLITACIKYTLDAQ